MSSRVNSASPYRTLGDYLADARAHPGTLTNASVGPATAQHIALEMLKRAANVDISFVPFSGNVPAVNALLGGHVTSVIVNYQDVAELVKAGKLRALATTLPARLDEHTGRADRRRIRLQGLRDRDLDRPGRAAENTAGRRGAACLLDRLGVAGPGSQDQTARRGAVSGGTMWRRFFGLSSQAI